MPIDLPKITGKSSWKRSSKKSRSRAATKTTSKMLLMRCYEEMDEEILENEDNESEMEQEEGDEEENSSQTRLMNDLEKQYKDLATIFNSDYSKK